MGLIDRAKHIRAAALDVVAPQRVVFHHVPKCGGTSLGRALRRRYIASQATVAPEPSFRAMELFTRRSDREAMLVDVLDLREQMMLYLLFQDIRCISLHVRFSKPAHDAFSDRYRFVTLLREPVDRFLSNYNWNHARVGAHAHIPEGFDQFLETDRARRMGATYPEFFSGLPKDADFSTPEAIAAACANLDRFDAVGTLDDLDGFRSRLRAVLGLRIRIGHENRAPGNGPQVRRADLTPAQRARVETLCQPDIAVWSHLRAGRPGG